MSAEVIYDLPFHEYQKIDAEHSGVLQKILDSAKAYLEAKEHDKNATDTMRLGSAVHTKLLEPDRFESGYVVWKGSRRYGKEWGAFAAANCTKEILTQDQFDKLDDMVAAVKKHPAAMRLLGDKSLRTEVTVVFTHGKTGIKLKARVDMLSTVFFGDLKTARDADPARFGMDAARRRYHFQLALYNHAVVAAGMKNLQPKIIAIQNGSPFEVLAYSVPSQLMVHGEVLVEDALERLRMCRETDKWPGICDDEELPLTFPRWAIPDEELEY